MDTDDDYMNDFDNNLNNNNNLKYTPNNNLGFNNLNNNNYQNQIHFQSQLGINNNMNQKLRPNEMPFHDYRHEKNILYISDLPYNTNETDIKLFFKRYGDSVSLITLNQKYHNENDTRPISAKVIFKDLNKSITLNIWDTAGKEKYKSLIKFFYKDASIKRSCN